MAADGKEIVLAEFILQGQLCYAGHASTKLRARP